MRALVFGYHSFGCLGLDSLIEAGFDIPAVFTHRDNPNEEIWWPSLADRAKAGGIPVHFPETMKDPSVKNLVASYKPDFLFSFYFRFMIPRLILDIAPRGALNLHGSLLPKYRGRAPVNWVLINGEHETGVSLHYMADKPDAGDLVDQERVPIAFDDTPGSLFSKLGKAAESVLGRSLPRLMNGTAPRRPMDLSAGSYYGGRKSEDGLLLWNRSALSLYNLTRGVTHPYPGAFTWFREKKLFVWWAKPMEEPSTRLAGQVTAVSAEGIDVAAGSGLLRLLVCQLEGEEEMPAGLFASKHKIVPGERLGESARSA